MKNFSASCYLRALLPGQNPLKPPIKKFLFEFLGANGPKEMCLWHINRWCCDGGFLGIILKKGGLMWTLIYLV
jgi:hypothetical protein